MTIARAQVPRLVANHALPAGISTSRKLSITTSPRRDQPARARAGSYASRVADPALRGQRRRRPRCSERNESRTANASLRGEVRATVELPRTQTAGMGVQSISELALRPGFSPQARMPPTARVRHEARGLGYWF